MLVLVWIEQFTARFDLQSRFDFYYIGFSGIFVVFCLSVERMGSCFVSFRFIAAIIRCIVMYATVTSSQLETESFDY